MNIIAADLPLWTILCANNMQQIQSQILQNPAMRVFVLVQMASSDRQATPPAKATQFVTAALSMRVKVPHLKQTENVQNALHVYHGNNKKNLVEPTKTQFVKGKYSIKLHILING